MKSTLLALSLLTLGGAVLAQDPTPQPTPKEPMKAAERPDLAEAAAGEALYFRYCAACHGQSLKGDGPVASGLVKKPIDLTMLATKNGGTFPFDKVAAMIDGRETPRMHGTPDMPVWGEIFAVASGTDAPNATVAVRRITHFVWANQAKAAAK